MLQTHAFLKKKREMNFFSTDVNVNMFFFLPLKRASCTVYDRLSVCARVCASVCVCLFWRISGGGVAVWELHEF